MSHPIHLESSCAVLCIFLTRAPRGPRWPDSPSPPSASLAPAHGELGDFSPKAHGAHGTISLALPFGCARPHPWGPSRVRSRGLIVMLNILEGQSVTTAIEPFTDAGL